MVPPEMEDAVRSISYDFGTEFLRKKSIATQLQFAVGPAVGALPTAARVAASRLCVASLPDASHYRWPVTHRSCSYSSPTTHRRNWARPQAVENFRMIERHYFRDRLIKSFDFTFGFVIPNSSNSWEVGTAEMFAGMPRSEEEMRCASASKSQLVRISEKFVFTALAVSRRSTTCPRWTRSCCGRPCSRSLDRCHAHGYWPRRGRCWVPHSISSPSRWLTRPTRHDLTRFTLSETSSSCTTRRRTRTLAREGQCSGAVEPERVRCHRGSCLLLRSRSVAPSKGAGAMHRRGRGGGVWAHWEYRQAAPAKTKFCG